MSQHGDNAHNSSDDEEFATQQAALYWRRAEALRQMQEEEDRLAEEARERKETRERERREKAECERREKAEHERLERERAEREEAECLERERLERQRKEEEEEHERREVMMASVKVARQELDRIDREKEVREYLERVEAVALMQGKKFYLVQKSMVGTSKNASSKNKATLAVKSVATPQLVDLVGPKGQYKRGIKRIACKLCTSTRWVCAVEVRKPVSVLGLMRAEVLRCSLA
jgi:hypothetical protein